MLFIWINTNREKLWFRYVSLESNKGPIVPKALQSGAVGGNNASIATGERIRSINVVIGLRSVRPDLNATETSVPLQQIGPGFTYTRASAHSRP